MISVILAAGAGRRLGGTAKALLRLPGGETFLERIVASANAAGATSKLVVVGPPFEEEVAVEARRLDAVVVCNPAPERGMATSVAIGFEHALGRFGPQESALLWPVDTPLVAPSVLSRLGGALGLKAAVIPTHLGKGGHPVLVARTLWRDLASCGQMSDGARSVFRDNASAVLRLEVGDPGVRRDVDIPAQMEQLGVSY